MPTPYSPNEDRYVPISKFESMLKTNTVFYFDATDFEGIIHHYLNVGKLHLAKKAIAIGLEQHPGSTEIKLLQVEVFVFEEKLDKAEALLDPLFALEPSNEELYIQKANIFSRQDLHHKAISFLKKALELAQETADIYSLIAMEYLFLDDYPAAKQYFKKCLLEDPEDHASLYNIIYCYDYLEDTKGAIYFLNDYLENNPYSEVGWHQLGMQYTFKRMYKEALACFDFAIIADTYFIGAYLEKAKVLEKLAKYDLAIENYSITLELDDPTAFALLRIGKCHEKLKNHNGAKTYYHKAVHEDPLLAKGWMALCLLYLKEKNYPKALYFNNKALYIEPENALYWKRNAMICSFLNLQEEASIAYQKCTELGNYELSTWQNWIQTLYNLEQYQEALQICIQAMAFHPERVALQYQLAGIYFTLLEPVHAKQALLKALQTDHKAYASAFKKRYPHLALLDAVKNIVSQYRDSCI